MTKLSKKRLQKLAGIREEKQSLFEGQKMFGIAQPAVLGNPFGAIAITREQKIDNSAESTNPALEDELETLANFGSKEHIQTRREEEQSLMDLAERIVEKLDKLGDWHNINKAMELLRSMRETYLD